MKYIRMGNMSNLLNQSLYGQIQMWHLQYLVSTGKVDRNIEKERTQMAFTMKRPPQSTLYIAAIGQRDSQDGENVEDVEDVDKTLTTEDELDLTFIVTENNRDLSENPCEITFITTTLQETRVFTGINWVSARTHIPSFELSSSLKLKIKIENFVANSNSKPAKGLIMQSKIPLPKSSALGKFC
uniref:Uncharacterized protein n=1 Tax=Timema genevievae TaxID=629358 RepID=A0A7R9KA62_TIMGE|nr:unnamed protein product [Timema genevievae]